MTMMMLLVIMMVMEILSKEMAISLPVSQSILMIRAIKLFFQSSYIERMNEGMNERLGTVEDFSIEMQNKRDNFN